VARDHVAMSMPHNSPDPTLTMLRVLAGGGPQTAREVAERAGLEERYTREWLDRQADLGRVTYDPAAEIFLLTPKQEATLAREAGQTRDQQSALWH